MAYRGRYQLGQHLPLLVLCRNGNDTPTVPSDVPRATIWSPGNTRILAKDVPVLDRFGQTGLFGGVVFLNNDYSTHGTYTIEYRYLAGGHYGIDTDQFEIMAGGHKDGSVIAMHYFDRPHAKFIVQQLDSGRLVQGRNPSV